MLVAEGLRAGADDCVIVRRADFGVGEGETLYIVGPNGAGKSTLLKALVGYPGIRVEGRVFFMGEEVTDKPPDERARKGLVLSHQFIPRIDGITVGELIAMVAKVSGSGVSVDEVAEMLEIRHLLGREFGKGLSGGEMKRVEIAATLVAGPKLALIDEPDSGVDVESTLIIAEGIKEMIKRSPVGSAVIVTHTGFISKYVPPTRVCIMREGVLGPCSGPELLDKVLAGGFRVEAA